MTIKSPLLFFIGMSLPAFVLAGAPGYAPSTVRVTEIQGAAPADTARIVTYHVDAAQKGSGYETGSLHIVYSDKTDMVVTPPPLQKSMPGDFVDNQVGVDGLKVAEDKRTIAWSEMYDTGCCSYSIPLVLAVYRSGKQILHISQGQVVWFWEFQDGGKQIAAVWAANHGPFYGDYQLYDTATSKLLAEVYGNEQTQSLDVGAPEWARQAETDCGRCGG